MTAAGLSRAIASAVEARARLRTRPDADIATALDAAARAWVRDPTLAERLAATTGLHATMLAQVLPLVAGMLEPEAMLALAKREGHTRDAGPAWIAHVLASNVPALAVPAIALTCLAGAAVVVKSGHRDADSAPSFQRALATVDPALAATVVPVAWSHSPALDDVLLDAPLAVLTGHDDTVTALAARATGRVLTHGTRYGALLLDPSAPLDLAAAARDVALYEQRGCLSPHVAFVVGDARDVARGLAAALEGLAKTLPPARAPVEDRAAVRAFLDEAAWSGAEVAAGPWGAVVLESSPQFRPTCGARTIRVVPLANAAALPALLPANAIECLGTNVSPPLGLRERGVARVCPVGSMQAPPLAWPRGQRPALGSLLGDAEASLMSIEP